MNTEKRLSNANATIAARGKYNSTRNIRSDTVDKGVALDKKFILGPTSQRDCRKEAKSRHQVVRSIVPVRAVNFE